LPAYPILMSMIGSGAHVVFPTPQGYRGEGVFDNFWKLIERYKVTYLITVPTALAALMQRPVNADISSLRTPSPARRRCRSSFTTASRRKPGSRSSKATA
jgi:acyl-coenzyme A synthetase/AMP-(fatty) acid ligase